MFITLLIVTFLIAVLVSGIVSKIFQNSISKILQRILNDSISTAWQKYLSFAIYVVGISNGVRIWQLERYITPSAGSETQILILTTERWVMEVYRTIIGTLQGIAWLLLVFFIFALIAFVIVKVFEMKKEKS